MPESSKSSEKKRLGASVAVFDENGTVLLVKRGKQPLKGYWALPGGSVEENETPIDAAYRELLEETGLIANNLKLVTKFIPHRIVDGKCEESDFFIHVFATFSFTGSARAMDDAEALAWVDLECDHGLNLTPKAEEIVEQARIILLTDSLQKAHGI